MPTRPATASELTTPDGPSVSDLPFFQRLLAEYNAIGTIAGFDEVGEVEKSDIIACQIWQILA